MFKHTAPLGTFACCVVLALFWIWQLATVHHVHGRQCPPCGNQTVPYPLSTSTDCGHPLYGLSCISALSQLHFHSISGTYIVRYIAPASQVLTLAPPPLLSNGSSCISQDLVNGGLKLNQSQPFTITSANSLIFFNCTRLLLQSPLNCTPVSPCNKAFASSGDASCSSLLCCYIASAGPSNLFSVPLNESACSAYTSVVSLDQSLAPQNWEFGVQVQWATPTEPPCTDQQQCPPHSICRKNTTHLSLCLCKAGYVWNPSDGSCQQGSALKNRIVLVAGLTPSLLVALTCLAFIGMVFCRKRKATQQTQAKLSEERLQVLSANGAKAALFSVKEMKAATANFNRDHLLGSGGFGEVYKGVLSDGTVVAVKVAKLGNVKGNNQILNEVRILSQVNHRNLVRLLGCCIETEQPLMVYEYVPSGNLSQLLSLPLGNSKHKVISWERRLCIAKETAEGLAYLHSFACPPIIHRDVKSSNILLDANMTAKVSDFGLSRLVEKDVSHVSTCAQGTLGYLDPHYYRNYQLTEKSDVYSFGVVLLELVTSQRAIDFSRGSDDINLAVYVGDRFARGRLDEVLDAMLVETASRSEIASMKEVIMLAMACLQEDGGKRPRMVEVVHQINSNLQELGRGDHSKLERTG